MKLFLDMDGVLTDFTKKLTELLGHTVDKDFKDPKIWDAISKAGKEFWSKMEWLTGAHQFFKDLKKFDPTILSSPSNHPSSIEGKKEWLKEELPKVPYLIKKNKETYAAPDAILIDDREDNIKKWEDNGGIGILHKSIPKTMVALAGAIKDLEFKKEKEAMSALKTIERPDGTKVNTLNLRQQDVKGRGDVFLSKKDKENDPRRLRKDKSWKKEIYANKLRKLASSLENSGL